MTSGWLTDSNSELCTDLLSELPPCISGRKKTNGTLHFPLITSQQLRAEEPSGVTVLPNQSHYSWLTRKRLTGNRDYDRHGLPSPCWLCCCVRQAELHALLWREPQEFYLLYHQFFKTLGFLNIYLKEVFMNNCLEGIRPGYFLAIQTDKILSYKNWGFGQSSLPRVPVYNVELSFHLCVKYQE